ncbi:hypothetical hypothetical protein [Rhizobium mesoamericanum STM3625]|uniref:Uncharacterized protein n=1 Tax=Rhizobium mesoamericanum STM3625 TaxID=1211777 RepID=K0Q1X3_9HYPH|nr:hypothetical hypothetical protein [Rhizobium mesoamericanum STM3625]
MVLASILGATAKIDQAKRELDWLDAKAPALMPMVKREISMRLARPEDQERVLQSCACRGRGRPGSADSDQLAVGIFRRGLPAAANRTASR